MFIVPRQITECSPPQLNENTITLGPVGFALAQGVYHPATPWSVKEANQFMAAHLKLDSQQDAQLNSDLKQENFLGEYKKLPQLQHMFNFKKHQQAAAVTLRTLKKKVTPAKGEYFNDVHFRMLSWSACSKE